jgi:hypothetical protein
VQRTPEGSIRQLVRTSQTASYHRIRLDCVRLRNDQLLNHRVATTGFALWLTGAKPAPCLRQARIILTFYTRISSHPTFAFGRSRSFTHAHGLNQLRGPWSVRRYIFRQFPRLDLSKCNTPIEYCFFFPIVICASKSPNICSFVETFEARLPIHC